MTDSHPLLDRETAVLLARLQSQRRHILGILDGLDDETMRRAILPSGWTCIGLIQHLAIDVERFWFRAVVVGEQETIDWFAAYTENAWLVDVETPVAAVLDLYQQEVSRANAIIAATPIDTPPAWWPGDLFGDFRLDDLREIILHVITETAVHAGHLDIVRELIDGRYWLVLTS